MQFSKRAESLSSIYWKWFLTSAQIIFHSCGYLPWMLILPQWKMFDTPCVCDCFIKCSIPPIGRSTFVWQCGGIFTLYAFSLRWYAKKSQCKIQWQNLCACAYIETTNSKKYQSQTSRMNIFEQWNFVNGWSFDMDLNWQCISYKWMIQDKWWTGIFCAASICVQYGMCGGLVAEEEFCHPVS